LVIYPVISAGAMSFNFQLSKSFWPDPFESLNELCSLHGVPLGDSVERISIYEEQAKESKDIPVYLIHIWNPGYDRDIERHYDKGYFDGRIGKNRESRIEKFKETCFSVADLGKYLLCAIAAIEGS